MKKVEINVVKRIKQSAIDFLFFMVLPPNARASPGQKAAKLLGSA